MSIPCRSLLSISENRLQPIDNAARFHARGGTFLYGTDFGNTTTTGIDIAELDGLTAAGLDGAAILAAGTSAPAAYWGLKDLGAVEVGKLGSILVLAEDPLLTPSTLASPIAVYIDGVRVDGSAKEKSP